jgi:hypothetical protein
MIATRVSARASPPELFFELRDGGALHHQRLLLSAESLLASGADFSSLARQLHAAAPSTAGLVPAVALSQALRAIASALQAAHVAPPVPAPAAPAAPPSLATSLLAGIGDLQRAGPAQLQAAKSRMDIVFEANRTRPENEGFQYDVRASFAPVEASDWD